MAYRTKIEVRTGGEQYLPGTILPEDISPLDLAFLKRKKFVEVVDADPLATLAAEDSDEDPDNDGFTDGFGGVDSLKSADEIMKLRSKADVAQYAASIGLDLGEDYKDKALDDLKETVINFQEEMEAGSDDGSNK